MTLSFQIRRLDLSNAGDATTALAEVLHDCVTGGASVSFMADISQADALAFWAEATTANDGRAILVAEDDAGIFGVVQVIPAWPPNQRHRAEISKLLVHRRGRRRGAAEALMRGAEDAALGMGRWMLTLDTATHGAADHLYAKLGWTRSGVIPAYALMPDGVMSSTTIFYKALGR